jgi:hypothetical protein
MPQERLAPMCGDYITGRCVTMNSMHNGAVVEVVGTHRWESTVRYRITCDDGRDRVVFHQGFAAPHSRDSVAPRTTSVGWQPFDELAIEGEAHA